MPQFKMAPNLSNNIKANCAIFNAVYASYIEAVYFTDTGEDENEQPHSDAEMSPHAQFAAMADCAEFLAQCADNGALSEYADSGQTWEQFGVDFWLTRNRHGAGFWDRGLGALGDNLSKMAKLYGSQYIYQGDDGLIYFG